MSTISMSTSLAVIFPGCDSYVNAVHEQMQATVQRFREKHTECLFDRVEEFCSRPAKFVRSMTLAYITEQLGGEVAKAHACGAALEIYHAASLIFDDIQDGSEVRRTRKAVHVTEGLSMSISLGAILRSLMYHPINYCDSLSESERRFIHSALDDTCTRVACGQAMEMLWRKHPEMEISSEAYIDMISKKTGCLIATAFTMGAFLGAADEETATRLGRFGEQFGIVFQLHNDLMDLVGGEMIGRPPYDDLRNCKRTFIVVQAIASLKEMGATADHAKMLSLFRERRLTDEQVNWCAEQLNRTGQIEAARLDLARRLALLVRSVDEINVPLALREMLIKLLRFFVMAPVPG